MIHLVVYTIHSLSPKTTLCDGVYILNSFALIPSLFSCSIYSSTNTHWNVHIYSSKSYCHVFFIQGSRTIDTIPIVQKLCTPIAPFHNAVAECCVLFGIFSAILSCGTQENRFPLGIAFPHRRRIFSSRTSNSKHIVFDFLAIEQFLVG